MPTPYFLAQRRKPLLKQSGGSPFIFLLIRLRSLRADIPHVLLPDLCFANRACRPIFLLQFPHLQFLLLIDIGILATLLMVKFGQK